MVTLLSAPLRYERFHLTSLFQIVFSGTFGRNLIQYWIIIRPNNYQKDILAPFFDIRCWLGALHKSRYNMKGFIS